MTQAEIELIKYGKLDTYEELLKIPVCKDGACLKCAKCFSRYCEEKFSGKLG